MKTYNLTSGLWLPQPPDRVFKFFADPQNLERITPPWLHFEILIPAETQIGRGTLLNYRLRLRGLPLRWQSEIAVWEPPHRFVDRQTRGPYRLWVHEHRFSAVNSGTMIEDEVEYAVRGGKLIQKFFIAPDLARIFRYRSQTLAELFNPQRLSPSEKKPSLD
jgi:ligand-binding SRPBCC domain-containing protein